MHTLARALPLLLLVLLALPATAADDDVARLKILDDPAHAEHDEAMDWWDERSEAEQLAVLQRALASEDPATALLAARALPHPYTTGAELQRRQRLLRGDLESSFGKGPDWGFSGEIGIGAEDVVPLYKTAAASTTLPIERSTLDGLHRCARPESVPALVALLEKATGDAYGSIAFTLHNLAEFDREDTQRAAHAQAMLYTHKRARAEEAKQAVPRLADVRVDVAPPKGGGLPPAVKHAHTWAQRHWLQRWIIELTPGPQDIEYLREVIRLITEEQEHVFNDVILFWALRHLYGMPNGKAEVDAWAAKEPGEIGLFSAGVLALHGKRERFDAFLKTPTKRDHLDTRMEALCWSVDRGLARQRAVARIKRTEPQYLKGSDDLAFLGRVELERFSGVRVGPDDLAAIGDALWSASEEGDAAATQRLVWFHTVVHPAGLTEARAKAMCARLVTLPPQDWTYAPSLPWTRFFALLEAHDHHETAKVLSQWMKSQPGSAEHFLPLLARMGVSGHEKAMFAAWPAWDPIDQCALGRVPGKAVEAYLVSKRAADHETTGDPVRESWLALCALLWRARLPAALAPLFESIAWEYDDDEDKVRARREKAWTQVLAGDAVAAVLTLADGADRGLHALGEIHDKRVYAWLAKRRAERIRGDYWQVTAALAHHDAAARAEVLALLGSGRTWVLSDEEGAGLALARVEEATAVLLASLDTNCCLGWAAGLHLKAAWPWFTVRFGMGGPGMRHTRAFIERHEWHHSRILGGPVPLGR